MASTLPAEKKIIATAMLCEGNSIRSIERMTGVHRDTIMRLGVRMGEECKRIMDERLRALPCRNVQVDEVWGFIGKKQKNATPANRRAGEGDVWTWIAIDADTKIVPTFAVGDRVVVERLSLRKQVAHGPRYCAATSVSRLKRGCAL